MPAISAASGDRWARLTVMKALRMREAERLARPAAVPHHDSAKTEREAMPMTPRERLPYSAIVDRPPLMLPDGARVVVWTIVNLESWSIERAMPRVVLTPPMGQPILPDVPNWAWHEYGMRVGFWRFLELFAELGVRP